MDLELHEFQYLDMNLQHEVAVLVSEYTNGRLGEIPQMIPITPGMVLNKHMGFIAVKGGMFAGYIGAKEPENHNGHIMPEVGSLWVPEEFRKHGIAHELVSIITNSLVANGELPYAFCNPKSKTIFKKSGYVGANVINIPTVAFNNRGNCNLKPGASGYCGRLLIYDGEDQ